MFSSIGFVCVERYDEGNVTEVHITTNSVWQILEYRSCSSTMYVNKFLVCGN